MNSNNRHGSVPLNRLWSMLREFCRQRSPFFAAVIFLISAAMGTPAFAQTVIWSAPVGHSPANLVVNSATNMIYVTNGLDSTVTVVDGATKKPTATINVGFFPN